MIFTLPNKYITLLKDYVQTMTVELKDGDTVTMDRNILRFNSLDVDCSVEPFRSFPDDWFSEPLPPKPDFAKQMIDLQSQITTRMAMRVKTHKKEFFFIRVPLDGNICNVGTINNQKGGYIIEVGDSNAVGRSNFEAVAHRIGEHWAIESIEIVDAFKERIFEIVEKHCSYIKGWYKTENSSGSAQISTFMSDDEVRCKREREPHLEFRPIGVTSLRMRKEL